MMGWNEFVPPHFSISGLVAQLGERSVRIREVVGSNPIRSTIKSCEILCFTVFCDFFKDLSRMRTERFRLVLEIIGNNEPKWFASKNRIWKVKEAGIKIDTSLFSVYKNRRNTI